MGNPRAGARAHDRLQRGDQTARRSPGDDVCAPANVDVGLAVGYDHHLLPAELAVEDPEQRLGGPGELVAVARSVLGFEVADQAAEIARDRSQLRWIRLVRRAPEAFPAHERPQALDPAPPAQLGDDDGDQRDRRSETDEEEKQILSRFLAAPRDEAHVVHEHQVPGRRTIGLQWPHRDEQRALGAL